MWCVAVSVCRAAESTLSYVAELRRAQREDATTQGERAC
jgi:hypothetical protein